MNIRFQRFRVDRKESLEDPLGGVRKVFLRGTYGYVCFDNLAEEVFEQFEMNQIVDIEISTS